MGDRAMRGVGLDELTPAADSLRMLSLADSNEMDLAESQRRNHNRPKGVSRLRRTANRVYLASNVSERGVS
jgi:hypothetical protein